MKVADLVRKYQTRIKALREEHAVAYSYGGPVVGLERINQEEREIEILETVIEDLGSL